MVSNYFVTKVCSITLGLTWNDSWPKKYPSFIVILILHYDRGKLYPAGIYLFRLNNGNIRRMCEICSKLTIAIRPTSLTPLVTIKNEKVIFSYLIYCSAGAQDIKMDWFYYAYHLSENSGNFQRQFYLTLSYFC